LNLYIASQTRQQHKPLYAKRLTNRKYIEFFLVHIIITKYDIIRYTDKIPECKKARLKEPIIVDIYKLD